MSDTKCNAPERLWAEPNTQIPASFGLWAAVSVQPDHGTRLVEYVRADLMADRLEELRAVAEKRCVWTLRADYEYKGTCGIEWSFGVGGRAEKGFQFCPGCGGRITTARAK
jgi:hypothetical protein